MKVIHGVKQGDYIFECRGCKCHHEVTTERKNDRGAQWQFNGNMNQPTFHPSIEVWHKGFDGTKQTDCHAIVSNGFIQYLPDCAHELKDQIIELPEIE